MFINRERWNKFLDWEFNLKHAISTVTTMLRNEIPQLVSCKRCGCAILKEMAYKSKAVIKEKKVWTSLMSHDIVAYISHDYYCKMHKPKEPKTSK